MHTPVRWGILGTGRMAGAFATALRALPDAELRAVASRSPDAAARFAAAHGIHVGHAGYEALAGDPDIDVVYVATPHARHARDALLCLAAGKAVLLEKPFTINAGEAAAVIAAARGRGLFVMEAMWTRFVPAMVALRRLLAEVAIGTPQLLVAGGAYIPDAAPGHYLLERTLGGGVLLDAGVYLVSLASLIFGAAVDVHGTATLNDDGIDVQDAMALRYAAGGVANLYVSLRARQSPAATLLGSEGRLTVHPPVFCPDRLTLARSGADEQVIEAPHTGSGYQYQAVEVMRCLREGRTESETMPLAESLAIMRTLDELRRRFGVRYPGEGT